MKIILPIVIAFGAGLLSYRLHIEIGRVSDFAVTSWSQDHKADCAIVLTGGAGRIREGMNLLSQRQIKKLIISGVYPTAELRQIFPEWPIYGELDPDDVILERRSGTTYGNAQQSLVLIEALHCKDAILVTSGLHMYRARKTFEGVFPKEFPMTYRSTLTGSVSPPYATRFFEGLKSLFYSLWAY